MAKSDSYMLQGLNGWEVVGDGQIFQGRSRGFQVLVDGTFDAINQTPDGGTASFSAIALTAGIFIGGTITSLDVSGGGSALVYPLDSSYVIS